MGPQFDIDGARKAGYSDEEIAHFLGKSANFDVDGALKAGYQPSEIIQKLQTPATPTTPTPSVPDPTDPNGPAWNHPVLETLKNLAMSPIRGIMGSPDQVRDWADRVATAGSSNDTNLIPREGSLPMGYDDPVGNIAGNVLMSIAPPEGSLRSPITTGAGRFVEPAPSALMSLGEHMMPAPVRVLTRAVRG